MSKIVDTKDYVCFDLETTGFGKCAEIIEIGAVKIRDNEVVETFSELVKPTHLISTEITEITGIRQSDVENCRNISVVLLDFLNFIGNDVLVGHNIASFDIPILRRVIHSELDRKFEPMYIDTMYLSREIKNVEDHKLQTMLDYYNIQNNRAHRAFQDCEANNKLLHALISDGIQPTVRYSIEYEKVLPEPKEHLDFNISCECLKTVVGKRIVLTGDFELGSRKAVEAILGAGGALIRNSVNKKTDYLIVGGYGSEHWKYENGGGKISEAQKLGITILPESAIQSILTSGMEVYNG